MFQLVSEDIKKLWIDPGLRVLILVILVSLIILSFYGILRKYHPTTLIDTGIIWCVYNLIYAVIPIAIMITFQTNLNKSTTELMSFWASILFYHLGGSDTFTAYSMEDNEIWRRHLMFMITQSVITFIIILFSLPGCSLLPVLSVFVYVAGNVKCFGRVYALRLGSVDHLRETMRGDADPGPNFVKLVEEYLLKTSQGFIAKFDELAQHNIIQVTNDGLENPSKEILDAYRLFDMFERIFVDHTLTYEDTDVSTNYFKRLDSKAAFRVVEIGLGFAYDKRYTKANVLYTSNGVKLHATCVFLILMLPLGFYFLSDIQNYRVVDIFITYVVFAVGIFKEIIAVVTMVRSDWTDVWLNQHNYTRDILKLTCLKRPTKRRWSNSIAQLELLSVALEEKQARFLRIQKLFGVDEDLEKERYLTYAQVSDNLKDMIYSQFKDFMNKNDNERSLSKHRVRYCLQQNKCSYLLWSINEDMEFDQTVVIWHIATSLLYWSNTDDESGVNRVESNHVSNYLMNLLVSNPEMLPPGNGMKRYRDTCADAKRFINDKGPFADKVEASKNLLKVDCNSVSPRDVIGDRSKTVLFYGVKLAQDLRENMNEERMWKMISQVWIEMLGYAAGNCRGIHHSPQLGRGGQLLTVVWFLMVQLGLTDHNQVSQGHARAKLRVS